MQNTRTGRVGFYRNGRALSRGTQRERAVKALLEDEGWFVVRAPASLGSADLLATRRSHFVLDICPRDETHSVGGHISDTPATCSLCPPPGWGMERRNVTEVLLVQVKSDHQKFGPFNNFGPKDRAELLADAEKAGGRATLAYWPPRGKLTWIDPDQWPENRQEAA